MSASSEGYVYLYGRRDYGGDIFSRESAFKVIFPNLVKSYAMDVILEKRGKKGGSKKSMEEAKKFLQEIKDCKEKKYPSVGQGWDYRFEGKDKIGSTFVYRKKIVHLAF